MRWQVQVRGCRHLSRPMLRRLFQRQRHAMEISHRFWLGDCEGFGHGSAGGHRSMRIHGGARSAAVRDPKVRLRGLSEIATNAVRYCGKADIVRSEHAKQVVEDGAGGGRSMSTMIERVAQATRITPDQARAAIAAMRGQRRK